MGRYEDYDDDRMVIVERESGGSGLGALLLGLVIGAGAALLLAPESGEAMRARIRRETRRATSRAKEYVDDACPDETVARPWGARARRVRRSTARSARPVMSWKTRAACGG